jgi:hypothetical protein
MKIEKDGADTNIVAEEHEEKLFTLLYHDAMREHVQQLLRRRSLKEVEGWLNLTFGAWKRRAGPCIDNLRRTTPDWGRIPI